MIQGEKHTTSRGAGLTGYGLVVGLIAVVAIAATSGIGSSVTHLFGETGNTLDDVVSETVSFPSPSASASDISNSAPTFSGSLPTPPSSEAGSPITAIDVSIFTDSDGDNLTFTLSDAGSGIASELSVTETDTIGNPGDTSDGTMARISGTPATPGTAQLTITATDPEGAQTTAGPISLTITQPASFSSALCAKSGQTFNFALDGGSNSRTLAFDANGHLYIHNLSEDDYEYFAFDSGNGTWSRDNSKDFSINPSGNPLGSHIRGGKMYTVTNSYGHFYRFDLATGAQEVGVSVSGVDNFQGITSSGSGNLYIGTYTPQGYIYTTNNSGVAQSNCYMAADRNRGATYDPTTGYYFFASSSTIRVVDNPATCNVIHSYARTYGNSQDIAYYGGFVFEQANDASIKAVPAYQNTLCD